MLPTVQKRIYAVARTRGGVQIVDSSRLLDVDIKLPSMTEQQAFTNRLATLAQERQVRRAQLAKLRRVREILMDNLTQLL